MKKYLFILCLMLVGCASAQQVRFINENATQEQFMRDRYDCIKASIQPNNGIYVNVYQGNKSTNPFAVDTSNLQRAAENNANYNSSLPSRGMFLSCMVARGYTQDYDGNLFAPQGTVIQMRR